MEIVAWRCLVTYLDPRSWLEWLGFEHSVGTLYHFPPMEIFLWAERDLVGMKKKARRIEYMSECILKHSFNFESFPPCCCCSVSVSQKLFRYPFRVLWEVGTLTVGTKNFKYRIKHSLCLFAKLIKGTTAFLSGWRGVGGGTKPFPWTKWPLQPRCCGQRNDLRVPGRLDTRVRGDIPGLLWPGVLASAHLFSYGRWLY